MCPIVQGYPLVLKQMNRPHERSVVMDNPVCNFVDKSMRRRQTCAYLHSVLGVRRGDADRAVTVAESALGAFRESLRGQGERVIRWIKAHERMGVILAARPYHFDPLVNHGIPRMFASLGVPLLTLDSLPGLDQIDLGRIRPEIYNPYHSEVYAAGLFAATCPHLEVVQLVSFGCGHDAITSDELARVMRETCGKEPLVLKIDEGEAGGALGIRIRSFVETARMRRHAE
jgi:predicted nucleotide-binding protein (sugar kinase/HSP70/actin superfamily)